jgi:hypothetical protein
LEKQFVDDILKILEVDFYIHREVMGTHFSGSRLRIDAVVRPKENTLWKNQNVFFGIEFKCEESLKDTKDSTHWIKQCIDYANTNWDDYGYMYVFSCPSVFNKIDFAIKGNEWLWNRILSNLGVGRLDYNKYHGWAFYLQDTHKIWGQNGGVTSGKHWTLKRKFGRDSFKHI